MKFSACLLALSAFVALAAAKTVEYNWTTTYITGNPDGTFERTILTVNDIWPPPVVECEKGDRIIVRLTNGFPDRNTSLHFHGLFQEGTNSMDGPQGVTQCPIPPGETMIYNFTVNQVGTYWYHSHTDSQYPDGFRGAMVIRDKDFPYDYDEELVITVSDWYHEMTESLIPKFLNRYNPTGAEPIPQNLLLNDSRNVSVKVEPGKRYLVRLVNIGGFVSQYFWIDGHPMTVVEVDGVYTKPNTTDMIYITVAQRYSFLLDTRNSTDENFAIMTVFDDSMLDVIPDDLQLNSTNYLVYNESAPLPEEAVVDEFDFLDDFYLVPYDEQELLPDPDHQVVVTVTMDNLGNGVNYAFFNNITYVPAKVPTLYSVFSAGDLATDDIVYGTNTHSIILEKDEIVELVLNNGDSGTHPFHLHGHVFQTVVRGPSFPDDAPEEFSEDGDYDVPAVPMKRDTLYVRPNSYFAVRFKADNPGVWFFHCHIEWHLTQGLAMIFIEDPLSIQANQTIPQNHIEMCKAAGVPYEGNAAANVENLKDLTGEPVQPKPLPGGFTARGIVALVFSCIAGVLGVIAIAIYGSQDAATAAEKAILRDEFGIDLDAAAAGETEAPSLEYVDNGDADVNERTSMAHSNRNSTSSNP